MKSIKNTFKAIVLVPVMALATACAPSAGDIPSFSLPGPLKTEETVTFDTWRGYEGRYDIVSFDGKDVSQDNRIAYIELDSTRYQDANGNDLSMVTMPLYASITPTSAVVYVFGPIEGAGKSTGNSVRTVTTHIYDYEGPIYRNGQTYALTLHLEVETHFNVPDVVTLRYTVEVKGQVEKTTHTLVLRAQ